MNPGRFFMPRMGPNMNPMIGSSINYLPSRNLGLFGRIGNSLKSFNWSGLLSGANKTLNVVNQTIPLVRQAGPMLNNMKSMMRIAKAFGSETTTRSKNVNRISSGNYKTIKNKDVNNETEPEKKEVSNDSYPNFFV